jgi:hypothetical protein
MPLPPRPATASFIQPGNTSQMLEAISRDLARKIERDTEPSFPSILLRAPDGSTWRLAVDAAGALSTTKVDR